MSGNTTLTVAGGNLFRIAAEELGDATQWNRIAAANGLWDPFLDGVVTLIIPPVDPNAGNGGILGQP
jgi:nucleoid-associated protein YgaU